MTDDTEESRPQRGGRPPSKKRGKFAFRVTADLREKLEASAEASGRPVSEEIEARLEASYRDPEIVHRTSERAIRDTVFSVLEDQYRDFGGYDGYKISKWFGKSFSERLKEANDAYPDSTVPWYRDERKIAYLNEKINPIAKIIIESYVNGRRQEDLTLEELAWRLNIPTFGQSQEQIRQRIIHFIQQNPNGENSPELL
ncbi:Arc family DNA-binding protein [Methylobacterium crusticola]|uniref:Arc family DNA-binding protein n=1 Tax=Methylobacterium crusticola TaxID=1697972 RepID=UPI000FFB7CD7|nr:Arc family DNA-binding protein [Methylobacterium crusticola]